MIIKIAENQIADDHENQVTSSAFLCDLSAIFLMTTKMLT